MDLMLKAEKNINRYAINNRELKAISSGLFILKNTLKQKATRILLNTGAVKPKKGLQFPYRAPVFFMISLL